MRGFIGFGDLLVISSTLRLASDESRFVSSASGFEEQLERLTSSFTTDLHPFWLVKLKGKTPSFAASPIK